MVFFDLAIVDPPYGINAPLFNNGDRKRKDGTTKESTATRIKKGRLNSGSGKLKNRILNTSNCNWDNVPPSSEYFDELFRVSKNQIIWGGNYFDLPPTRCVICWDKEQPWENFSQWEMAWTSLDKPASIFRYRNTGNKEVTPKIHPTQKPVLLYEWLLNKYSQPGYKILDTHLGSGSSRIAAYFKNLDFYGCELDQLYYEQQEKRFLSASRQMPLFL